MRYLPKSGFKSMPWKNGGGETIEIIKYPEDTGLDHFDWRISMALVASDGPFSVFPYIDRHLAVLSGKGIDLFVGESVTPVHLTPESQAHAFAGDAPTTATLTDGPITDLNVMVRRGVFRAELLRCDFAGRQDIALDADYMLFLIQQGAVSFQSGAAQCQAKQGDAVLLSRDDGSLLCKAENPSRMWQVTLAKIAGV